MDIKVEIVKAPPQLSPAEMEKEIIRLKTINESLNADFVAFMDYYFAINPE